MCQNQNGDERHEVIVENKNGSDLYSTIKAPGWQIIVGPRRTMLRTIINRQDIIAVYNAKNERIRQYIPTHTSLTRFKVYAGDLKNECRRRNGNHHASTIGEQVASAVQKVLHGALAPSGHAPEAVPSA